MMTRPAVEIALNTGFTNIGQCDAATNRWLAQQRKLGRVVAIGWSVFQRPIWGWAA